MFLPISKLCPQAENDAAGFPWRWADDFQVVPTVNGSHQDFKEFCLEVRCVVFRVFRPECLPVLFQVGECVNAAIVQVQESRYRKSGFSWKRLLPRPGPFRGPRPAGPFPPGKHMFAQKKHKPATKHGQSSHVSETKPLSNRNEKETKLRLFRNKVKTFVAENGPYAYV